MKQLRHPGLLAYFILFLVFFGAAYFYFVNSQTLTIYGDDLYSYREQAENTGIADIIAFGKNCFKFRPVMGIVTYFEVRSFGKSLFDFFLFNVAIQALIAVLFTAIVNLFLRSVLLSALLGLMAGLSRFAFYNITQIMCGGPMEGVALVLFLAALYNITVYLTYNSDTRRKSQFQYMVRAIIFANLAVYTHERYMVLFPVIILFVFFHPLENKLSLRQKVAACFFSAASLFANFAIKEYVYHYRFLLGTGTSSLTQDFNFKKQLGYLGDALASIVQFNSGPEYLIGVAYNHTEAWHQALVVLVMVLLCALLSWYIFSNVRRHVKNTPGFSSSLKLILCLLVLFFATLAPAVSTLEVEQRWLQAPLLLFVLAVVVAFVNIRTKHPNRKKFLFIFFVLGFMVSDYNYMHKMISHFWMKGCEWEAFCYKDLILNGHLGKEVNTVYYLEEKKDPIHEIQMSWLLADGYFFVFYVGQGKTITYIDSTKFTDPEQLKYMIDFDPKTQQIVTMKNQIVIVTDEVLKERDMYFKEHGINAKVTDPVR